MRSSSSRRQRPPLAVIGAAVAFACFALFPRAATPELRPLVRDMLETLRAINEIGESVALEDYSGVRRAAKELEERAGRLRELNLKQLGLEPARDAEFDAYLAAQARAAAAIAQSAGERDARGALRGVQLMFEEACIPCHSSFREPANLLSPATLFMTSYISGWKELNRGLATNDFALVSREARELQAMTKVLAWDQVIETTFSLEEADDRKAFREFLRHVTVQVNRIEDAAGKEDGRKIASAMREMWDKGCISCHERFR